MCVVGKGVVRADHRATTEHSAQSRRVISVESHTALPRRSNEALSVDQRLERLITQLFVVRRFDF